MSLLSSTRTVKCLTETQLWQTHKNKQQLAKLSGSSTYVRGVFNIPGKSLFSQTTLFSSTFIVFGSWNTIYPISLLCLASSARQPNGEHGHRRVIEVLVSTSLNLSPSLLCLFVTLLRSKQYVSPLDTFSNVQGVCQRVGCIGSTIVLSLQTALLCMTYSRVGDVLQNQAKNAVDVGCLWERRQL